MRGSCARPDFPISFVDQADLGLDLHFAFCPWCRLWLSGALHHVKTDRHGIGFSRAGVRSSLKRWLKSFRVVQCPVSRRREEDVVNTEPPGRRFLAGGNPKLQGIAEGRLLVFWETEILGGATNQEGINRSPRRLGALDKQTAEIELTNNIPFFFNQRNLLG